MSKTVPFQRIQFSISTILLWKTFLFQAIQLSQTILVQTIQFSINMQLVLFKLLIGPYHVLPFWARVDLEAMAMKGVLHIPPSSSIIGTPPSDWLVSYPGHSWGWGSYPSAEVQSVYSTAPANWTKDILGFMTSTIVCYLMPNSIYIHIYFNYMICKHFVNKILKWAWALFCPLLNGFKCCFK